MGRKEETLFPRGRKEIHTKKLAVVVQPTLNLCPCCPQRLRHYRHIRNVRLYSPFPNVPGTQRAGPTKVTHGHLHMRIHAGENETLSWDHWDLALSRPPALHLNNPPLPAYPWVPPVSRSAPAQKLSWRPPACPPARPPQKLACTHATLVPEHFLDYKTIFSKAAGPLLCRRIPERASGSGWIGHPLQAVRPKPLP